MTTIWHEGGLPEEYRIMPAAIKFVVPGFELHYRNGDRTLAPSNRDSCEWFTTFVDRVTGAIGRRFLPVCRMSDGEFRFILGDQPPDVRLPPLERVYRRLRRLLGRLREQGHFRGKTARSVSSGVYSSREWQAARRKYGQLIRDISEQGILALHLSYTSDSTFQQHYFPALSDWLQRNQIQMTEDNYVPFYFVYASLLGPRRHDLLYGRRILLVHSAQGVKRRRIEQRLAAEGASSIEWCEISPSRSFYDHLNLEDVRGPIDIAIVGAGVGKPSILMQLARLNAPCVDAGYVFEVWADDSKKWDRAFCVPDDQWDATRINFWPRNRSVR